ncbi:YncE family protein [Proteiniphilum sp.]|uniref:YncE family protein n=1 Tax=Proteiniphilum sp. TaxID=1926877 RepID=UPI002B1EF1B2|nr:DUF5074 domain-containing protein [Proteiniphilum sp.]MEA4918740.1 YncE family protein [Proteiniphilum sp.]
MIQNNKIKILFIICSFLIVVSCRKDELVTPTQYESIVGMTPDLNTKIIGLYLLNEGAMGTNTSTLDFVDYRTATYARNIYAEKNPENSRGLGDVGNDIQVHKGKLYVVINCSNKVIVLNAYTCEQIAEIEIPNCRYIKFKDNHGYVSAYDVPVGISQHAGKGAIYKIDLSSNTIVDKVVVGYQPEQIVIDDNHLYVANSGGYRVPNYDNTVSVVTLYSSKMNHDSQIEAGINLQCLKMDKYGKMWVSSRGDYNTTSSNLFVLDRVGGVYRKVKTLDVPCSNMALKGDSLYIYSVEYNRNSNKNTVTYALINVNEQKVISRNFITDGTDKTIEVPYGIAIHPVSNDIYITDARNYVSSGQLHCYDITGRKRWSIRTGNIPAHMVFLEKK